MIKYLIVLQNLQNYPTVRNKKKMYEMYGKSHLLILTTLLGIVAANPAKQLERMVIAKMRMSDQDGSETGYAYTQQQHSAPVSFVQYTSHTGSNVAGLPYDAANTYPPYNAYPFYYTYGDYDVQPLAPLYYPPQYLQPPSVDPYHHNVHHPYVEEEEIFEETGDNEHDSEDNSQHGEKGEKDYGSYHSRDQADNQHHEADHRQGELFVYVIYCFQLCG